jgi:copper transporter 1
MADTVHTQMLWNWETIDACFLTRSWRIHSVGGFAGTCILVVALVLVLEALRRVSHEYDENLARPPRRHAAVVSSGAAAGSGKAGGAPRADEDEGGADAAGPTAPHPRPSASAGAAVAAAGRALSATARCAPRAFRADVPAATMRALLHTCRFAVAYFVMLLAMYYNGYVLISIFVGAFLGAFLFGRGPSEGGEGREGEATYCCG